MVGVRVLRPREDFILPITALMASTDMLLMTCLEQTVTHCRWTDTHGLGLQ